MSRPSASTLQLAGQQTGPAGPWTWDSRSISSGSTRRWRPRPAARADVDRRPATRRRIASGDGPAGASLESVVVHDGLRTGRAENRGGAASGPGSGDGELLRSFLERVADDRDRDLSGQRAGRDRDRASAAGE